jgi:Flp pilus assembly protein TadB
MKKQIKEYIKEVEEKIYKNEITQEYKKDMLNYISFYQHERLIHLIVTLFVGICAIIFFLAMLYFEKLTITIIFIILIILFIPYIFHYYFLENNIQKLYTLYKKS